MAEVPNTNHQTTHELELTAGVVSAYVTNNAVPLADLPNLIGSVANALRSVSRSSEVQVAEAAAGNALPSHPDEYRAKWGLPHDYPMVAPNYAAAHSVVAKNIGLGRKRKEEPAPSKAKRGRSKSAAN